MRFWVLKAAASTPYAGAGGIVPAGGGHEAERGGSACRRPNGSLAPSAEFGSGAPSVEFGSGVPGDVGVPVAAAAAGARGVPS
jgi:hypothetical protein